MAGCRRFYDNRWVLWHFISFSYIINCLQFPLPPLLPVPLHTNTPPPDLLLLHFLSKKSRPPSDKISYTLIVHFDQCHPTFHPCQFIPYFSLVSLSTLCAESIQCYLYMHWYRIVYRNIGRLSWMTSLKKKLTLLP